MTQEFVYENDTVKSIEKMMTLVADSVICTNGKWITTDPGGLHWNDGSKYPEFPKAISCVDGKYRTIDEEASRMYHGVIFKEPSRKAYNSKDELCEVANEVKMERSQPKRMFLMAITHKRINKSSKYYPGIKSMMKGFVELLNKFEESQVSYVFFDECGDGYTHEFDSNDGSVGYGYRIEHDYNYGQDMLVLSMVHMYYGK